MLPQTTSRRTLHRIQACLFSRQFHSSRIKIVELGARDGLQNEKQLVSTDIKLELIRRLATSGLQSVEATAFVSPKWVPQMSDAKDIMTAISSNAEAFPTQVSYPVLVPNLKGYEQAVHTGAKEIAIFGAASESFSQKNINCSIAESLKMFQPLADQARKDGIRVRGYVSCVLGCPFEGNSIKPEVVSDITKALLDMGCYEVSLGDTIGVGHAASMERLLYHLLQKVDPKLLAVHCHDTYGQALANILVAVKMGIRVVDSSVGGLGGCPYAPGATGNVATEDVVYMLQGMGYDLGPIQLDNLVDISDWICQKLGRHNASRVSLALLAKRKKEAK